MSQWPKGAFGLILVVAGGIFGLASFLLLFVAREGLTFEAFTYLTLTCVSSVIGMRLMFWPFATLAPAVATCAERQSCVVAQHTAPQSGLSIGRCLTSG